MAKLSKTVCPTQSLLKALVDTIEDSKASATHLRETESFLDSIEAHLKWYDAALAVVEGDEDLAPPAIDEVSRAIYEVVQPIKQLCEGTRDRIPFELAVLLERELREAMGEEVRVALCPLPNLNFIYADVGSDIGRLFKGLCDWLSKEALEELPSGANSGEAKRLLDERPVIPRSHILIGFQYAMADDILFNSVLFHELGHDVFHSSRLWEQYGDNYKDELDAALEEAPPYRDRKESGEGSLILRKAVDACTRWTSEVFSDAFACALAGPHFAFAMSDLFRLKPKPRPNVFSNSHPADRVRQESQHHVLTSCGWFTPPNEVEASFRDRAITVFDELRVVGLEEDPEEWDIDQWKFDALMKQTSLSRNAIRCIVKVFFKHIRKIGNQAVEKAKDFQNRSSEFWQLGADVQSALEEHAVVPSTIVTARKAIGLQPATVSPDDKPTYTYHPRPSTVLNCARLIVESGTDSLVQTCYPGKAAPFEREDVARARYLLSEWVRKAIGDYNLLQDAHYGH